MSETMPPPGLEEFSVLIAERTGLSFPLERLPDLERAVASAAPELGFPDAGACIKAFLSSPPDKERLETLAAYLTVGETYFFRHKADFDAIENIILPALAEEKKDEESLRIWSAGCCTGEEPYSIAMLLNKCSLALKGRSVSILATDINSSALRAARRGVYGEWSFRDVPQHIRDTYFTKTAEKKLAVLPVIKKNVDFSYLNLVEDSYPSLLTSTNAMDLILCRNVLMYFRPDLAQAVLRKFHASLKDGGWLIVSPAEGPFTFPDPPPGLRTAQLPDVTVYRKIAEGLGASPRAYQPEAPAPALYSGLAAQAPAPPAAAEKLPLEEAQALYVTGDYSGAGVKLEALLAAEPLNAAGLLLLARVRANQGRLGEAGRLCAKAVEADKPEPLAHYLLGSIFLEEGRDDEAQVSFKRAIYLAPGNIPAHLALGNLSLRGGKVAQARRSFQGAAALLGRYRAEDLVPDSEGMTAGRLSGIVRSALARCSDD